MVSCSSAVTTEASSSFCSAISMATATGWVKYGSPLLRSWVECMNAP